MQAKPLLFLVVEDHLEVAHNCDFLRKFDPSAVCAIANTPQEALQHRLNRRHTLGLLTLYTHTISL